MRERFPRKTKKRLLKYYTRSVYSDVVHLKERCSIGIDIGKGESFSAIFLGNTSVCLEENVILSSLSEEKANHYKRFYNTPCAEADAIVAGLRESAKSQPNNMTKEEEIAYVIGDTGISESLIESVDQCAGCDAFSECSTGMFPVNREDKGCKYYSHE